MFALRDVIIKLRKACASFERRVGGTAELGQAYHLLQEGSDVGEVPMAFVVPLHEQDVSSELPDYNPDLPERSTHKIRQHFAVIVCLDNSTESGIPVKGNLSPTSVEVLATIQEELNRALMAWRIQPTYMPVRFGRSDHMAMNNAYLWHSFEWWFSYIVSPTIEDQSVADAVAAICNGWTDDVPFDGSPLSKVRQLHVGANREAPQPTAMDYYDPTIPLLMNSEEASAAQENQDVEIDVNPPVSPPMPPSPEQVAGAVYHRPVNVSPIHWHGMEEKEGGDHG